MNRKAVWLSGLLVLGLCPCPGRPAEIMVTVADPAGVRRSGWPVTSGVPLARGALRDLRAVALFSADGREVPLQVDALSRWPDGSVRWLLLDFQVDLKVGEKQPFTLRYGPGTRRTAVEKPVTVSEEGRAVAINTGPLRLRLSPTAFRLLGGVWLDTNGDSRFSPDEQVTGSDGAGIFLTAPDGKVFQADRAPAMLTIEDGGPLRASVRIEGTHASARGT